MALTEFDERLERLDFIKTGFDLLVLYLFIANTPETPPEIRDGIDQLIRDYLSETETTMREIWDNNKDNVYNRLDLKNAKGLYKCD
jgi:hypothetical protein